MSYQQSENDDFLHFANGQQVFWPSFNSDSSDVKNQKNIQNNDTCYTENNGDSYTKDIFYVNDQNCEQQFSIEEERQENKNKILTEPEQLIEEEQNQPKKNPLNQQNDRRYVSTFIFMTIFSNPLNPFPYPNLSYLNNEGIVSWFSQNFFQCRIYKRNNQQSKTDLNVLQPIQEQKSKKSLSSIDTHHVVKNFIQFFWTKLSQKSSLILLQRIFKSQESQKNTKENDKVSKKDYSQSKIQQQKEQYQDFIFDDYIKATKELLQKLTQQQGNKNKSYSWSILHQLTTIQSYKAQIFSEEVFGCLKMIIIKVNSSLPQKLQHKWMYKNLKYYEVTRRIMLWFLRRNHYTAHIIKSPLLKYKARNLKYVKRWIYELKYPKRCNKLYVANEKQYFQNQKFKVTKGKKKIVQKYETKSLQKSKQTLQQKRTESIRKKS